MNEHPRLRRAMAGLADRDTAADPAGVVARASAIRRRRYALTGGAAMSLATVLGVMAAFGTSASRGADVLTPLTESPMWTPEATGEPTVEPSESPSPVATTVAPTSAPRPGGDPSGKAPEPTAEPEPEVTYAPPGMTLDVDVAGSATTGQKIVYRIRVTDTDGQWFGGSTTHGDGTHGQMWNRTFSCLAPPPSPPPSPPPYRPSPSDETQTGEHMYTRAGTYTLSVTARTLAGGCGVPSREEHKTVTATITVTGEDVPTNGPEQPMATAEITEQNGLAVSLVFQPRDNDGAVVAYTLDWGDGSAPYTYSRDAACANTDPDAGYPRGGGDRRELSHTYATAGTYTITMTVTSAGCDGKDRQEGTGSAEVTVAPHEP